MRQITFVEAPAELVPHRRVQRKPLRCRRVVGVPSHVLDRERCGAVPDNDIPIIGERFPNDSGYADAFVVNSPGSTDATECDPPQFRRVAHINLTELGSLCQYYDLPAEVLDSAITCFTDSSDPLLTISTVARIDHRPHRGRA